MSGHTTWTRSNLIGFFKINVHYKCLFFVVVVWKPHWTCLWWLCKVLHKFIIIIIHLEVISYYLGEGAWRTEVHGKSPTSSVHTMPGRDLNLQPLTSVVTSYCFRIWDSALLMVRERMVPWKRARCYKSWSCLWGARRRILYIFLSL